MGSLSRAAVALEQIEFARTYTKMFLEDLTPEEWFWQPPEAVTHIAWQVGHLAIAEFGLACLRMRERPGRKDKGCRLPAAVDSGRLGSTASRRCAFSGGAAVAVAAIPSSVCPICAARNSRSGNS